MFPTEQDWPTVAPGDAGWDEEALADVVDWCGAHHTRQLLVLDHGRIVAERHWEGGAGEGGDDRPSTSDIASAQKCVVSFVVGQLLAEGLLDLDAPMTTWLGAGWTPLPEAQEREVLLRHVLSMTSGLYDDFEWEAAPGTTWYYNNNAYHQVRKAIEAVTGRSCQDAFAERLFDPIGMADSTWRERPQMVDRSGWALSGLHSSARDLGRFGLAVLAGGSWAGSDLGCDPSYLRASLTSSQALNPSYGYLWWVFAGERAIVPGVRPGDEPPPGKSFGGIAVDGPLARSAPGDAVSAMGAGDQRLYLAPGAGLVVVRLGRPAGARTAAGGSFDEQLWSRLARAAGPRLVA